MSQPEILTAEDLSKLGAMNSEDQPIIRVEGGSLPENVSSAERWLADATQRNYEKGVYQRGGTLVRIARLPELTNAGGIQLAAGSLHIALVGADFLASKLTESARWERFDSRSKRWVQIDAPYRTAKTLLDSAGSWSHTPNLAGIVESPCLRPDGSVLSEPGYDQASGIYFAKGDTVFPPIAAHPSQDQARAALDQLLSILAGFPFLDASDRSVAVALLMTPLARHAVRAAPITVTSAPTMASGKTLLTHLPAYIATGRPPALISQAATPEEERKRLLAILMEGSVVTVIDNCERPLKSDLLCTALTEPVIRDRVLGVSRTVSAPTTTTWAATGNNLQVAGDLSSRALLCRLDPECEHPEARQFEVNLHSYVPEHRGELATAVLTIIQAYQEASRPCTDISVFGRFEQWSRMVREPIVWLGLADPCDSRQAIEDLDPVRRLVGTVLEGWNLAFGSTPRTAGQVIALLEGNSALRELIEPVAQNRRGKPDPRTLGNFLARHERRIERGHRLERAGEHQHAVLWRVVRVEE